MKKAKRTRHLTTERESDQKKFEVLHVLNLLEKTELQQKDLTRGLKPKKAHFGDHTETLDQDEGRKMTQQIAIGDAIRAVHADRL